jgi:hypothetical protein
VKDALISIKIFINNSKVDKKKYIRNYECSAHTAVRWEFQAWKDRKPGLGFCP